LTTEDDKATSPGGLFVFVKSFLESRLLLCAYTFHQPQEETDMTYAHIGRAKLYELGAWLAEDPRRLTIIVTAASLLATVLFIAATSTHAPLFFAGNSDGGGGG
jgi:hypothetical protein